MKQIGRYIILGRLGRGGMSTVYKAKAPVTGRTVAVKILQPRDEIFADLVGESRLREIFIEEAKIMGEITHDHVAKILDCDQTDNCPFIVLEYFAHSIGSLIGEAYQVENRSRIISINKAFQYILQTLRGLERLHFAGIVHRDIKPYNLMLTNDDRIKIIDFGLSRVRGEEKMAIPGMQVGSPYYASPEQERDPENADERSDLFSVGVMAYRMVTGNLINIKEKIKRPSLFNPELNKDWDDFLLQSIQASPDHRFASAHQMRERLEAVASNWRSQSKLSCNFLAEDQAGPVLPKKVPRKEPAFILYRQLQKSFNLDSLMRPRQYQPHRFEFKSSSLNYCTDTGLLWQREGSGFTLNWVQAHEYINYLNAEKWQGCSRWRLPTAEELLTLLRPPSLLRDFCFESHISEKIHWVWSCDVCTKKKAWMADLQESYFHPLDKDGTATVCAVSSS